MEQRPPRRPDREGSQQGLAYTVWLPDPIGGEDTRGEATRPLPAPPWPGMVIVHGAGSCKENHFDFARLCAASGWAALAFDQRGHGASDPPMSPEAVDDVVRMARLLAASEGVDRRRVAVRGSSLGGFMAIHAAAASADISGVIAICPAGEEHLSRGIRRGDLEMRIADPEALRAWLGEHDLHEAVTRLAGRPLILLHAEGDDRIPSYWSEQLYECAAEPRRLILVPGGDHRSLQHDPELQAAALGWLERRLGSG